MSAKPMEDADRFLIFMQLIVPNPATKVPTSDSSADELVKYFELITGWDHNRARSAYEVGMVKGYFGQGEETK